MAYSASTKQIKTSDLFGDSYKNAITDATRINRNLLLDGHT